MIIILTDSDKYIYLPENVVRYLLIKYTTTQLSYERVIFQEWYREMEKWYVSSEGSGPWTRQSRASQEGWYLFYRSHPSQLGRFLLFFHYNSECNFPGNPSVRANFPAMNFQPFFFLSEKCNIHVCTWC